MSKILKGTMLLTGATFLSKLLGMIYTIPFAQMVGPEGTDLYFYAYTPYNILLSVSTLGVPLAVSKFVSKYNSLGDYQTSRRILRTGIQLMAVSGLIAFLVLFFAAKQMAIWTLSDGASPQYIEDTAMVIRMVSFALIIIPSMSIVRGFFQGNESMGPTAVSQVVEQIIRIVFLLIAVFIIQYVIKGSLTMSVGFATFAAFVGGLASIAVLYTYWVKRKPHLDRLLSQQEYTYDITKASMIKELLGYAGPFVLVGIATPLYQFVDQMTFNDAMAAAGLSDLAEGSISAINFLSHKLVIIPVTLGIGLSLAILPAITKAFTNDQKPQLFRQINQALQIVALLIVPAIVGLSIVAYEAYGTFYGMEKLSYYGGLLRWYAPVGLFFALYTVTASILQGINRQNFAVISLGTGLLIKICTNSWLVLLLGAKGAIVATGLAVASAVILNLYKIKQAINFSYRQLFKRTLLILILTVIMGASVWLVKWLLGLGLDPMQNRIHALLTLVLSVTAGAIVYLYLSYRTTLLERILGGRISKLDRWLKRK
ncbi:polysaccharide biosynthesis protein [Halobacillus salinarum]|uniref:Polysaccharide biosynthesis protein n=1 Tax=Halobacillus salinarum TaxID=2932257 RepID=A0ABY4EPH5_9BACI|nr:polysaccharide biosynthesis protein [Halobacillus salinarum]UOQ46099.1 polysaccharide biosynthesis protein [Halobacillus salinarum]